MGSTHFHRHDPFHGRHLRRLHLGLAVREEKGRPKPPTAGRAAPVGGEPGLEPHRLGPRPGRPLLRRGPTAHEGHQYPPADQIVGEFRGRAICCFERNSREMDADGPNTVRHSTVFAVTSATLRTSDGHQTAAGTGQVNARADAVFGGGKVMELGVPEFDEAFRVIANDEEFARNVLTGSLAQFLMSDPRAKDEPLRFQGDDADHLAPRAAPGGTDRAEAELSVRRPGPLAGAGVTPRLKDRATVSRKFPRRAEVLTQSPSPRASDTARTPSTSPCSARPCSGHGPSPF